MNNLRQWRIEDGFGIENLRSSPIVERALLDHEILVRIQAVSLNYRDLMVVKGEYNPRQPLPLVPVSDGSGVVVAVGPSVTTLSVGDRVCATLSQHWDHGPSDRTALKSMLGSPLDGMLRNQAIFLENGLIKYPTFLNFEEAATLPCAALTAFNALIHQAELLPGSTVLLQGTGGVSVFAQLFATALNLKTIVISSSDDKLARMRELGAQHTINYRQNPDWDKAALELTDGLGVDCVVEVVGGAAINKSIASLKRGGVICLIGVLGGKSDPINLTSLLMAEKKIHGTFIGNRSMFAAMNRVIAHKKIRPAIDKVFGFEDAKAAFSYLESAQHFGKIVIKME